MEGRRLLLAVHDGVVECRACPRLVEWREQVAIQKRAAYLDQDYWGRPVPGFGDPEARILVVGLAPAAHGANRTGRVFTGDRSGDFLFAALHRVGLANQPEAVGLDDGLSLTDVFITAPVRCAPPANKPTPDERAACRPFFQREVAALVDWLVAEVAHAGVDVRLPTPVDVDAVLAESPDVVVVATGGWPDTCFLESGADLVATSWDVLGGLVRPTGRVLVYDDHGAERGLAAVEHLVEERAGYQAEQRADRQVSTLELVTPDRHVGYDLATPLGPAYLRILYGSGVVMISDHRLVRVESVEGDGSALRAVLRNEYTGDEVVHAVDAVVVEHGVVPDEHLYLSLRDGSANAGVVDLVALAAGDSQPAFRVNPGSTSDSGSTDGYLLYRVGDCVASRDVASALLEARRLLQHL